MIHTPRSPRVIAVASVLAAVCLAIQLTPRPPNVELTSLLTFTSGFLFGSIFGFLFGCFVMFVNGFLSSWGFAGLNMPFQMAGMGLIGLFGGLYGSHVKSYGAGQLCVEAAIMGAFLTLSYDLLTNLGMMLYYVMNGMVPGLAFAITAAYGVPFLLVHVASNIAVFGILFFPLIKTLNHNLMVRNIG